MNSVTASPAPSDINGDFRAAMRRLATTVTVLTARGAAPENSAQKFGITATAVTSLSMDPPSLLVCINRKATIDQILQVGMPFAVNLLGEAHQEISQAFGGARSGQDRFAIGEWAEASDGTPYLRDALASILCHITAIHEHTTHNIVIGEARKVRLDGEDRPLLYFDGQYGKLE